MSEFNKNVIKWIDYDNEIKKYNDKLKYNKNKSYETMTNKYLIDKFTKYFNDEDKALHLFNFLKEERSLTSKCCLKRD